MSEVPTRRSVWLLDAHGLVFQVFHAIGPMTSPSGMPSNALFGFARDLLYLKLEIKPDYLICVFDPEGPTFRERLYPQYKANRGPMPDDLRLQLGPIKDVLAALCIPTLSIPDYEADDVLATLATAADRRGADVFICSNDKDCRQLISERVRMYNLRKNTTLDRAGLLQDWGVTPEQVVDLQTLVGDSVDNVPGVPGIGIKTAAQLLQEFGTLDNLLANIDKVSGTKRRENLQAAGDIVALSRKLVRLETNVPFEQDWDGWQLQPWDAPKLVALFREWGLSRLTNQVQAVENLARIQSKTGGRRKKASAADEGPDLFSDLAATAVEERLRIENDADDADEPEAAPSEAYHLVNDDEKLTAFLQQLQQQTRFAIDLETTSLDPAQAEIVGVAMSWRPEEAYYLALMGPAGSAHLDAKRTLEQLRPILEDERVEKVNQHIKYDQLVLRWNGVKLAGVVGDSMVAHYLLHPGERSHGLEAIAPEVLGRQKLSIEKLIGKGKKQKRMDEVAPELVAPYACRDADLAWCLCAKLEPELDEPGLRRLYDELEVPLIEVLAELEFNGIRLEVARLQKISKDIDAKLAGVEEEIYALAGEKFNIASLKQLRVVLYDKLKLPVRRKTGITGAASTDQETLEWLAKQKEGNLLPQKLLWHRHLAKLKGTYVDPLPELVNAKTGRIHAKFNQTTAETGRLSSSEPNLQNIPIRTDDGGEIRQAFVPEPGWKLLTADYSQIELRLLAQFSEDEELRRAFQEERDVHTLVAAQINNVAEKVVTSSMRRVAKTVNFGVIYGMSAFGLAQRLDISKEEAEQFIKSYFARYPRVLEYQQKLLQRCRADGYVGTILGRRRWFSPDAIRPDSTYQQRNQAEREVINMEIQGSAADLIKTAMLAIHRRLRKEGRRTRMLLQIHDELVFETPPEELNAVAKLVEQEMTSALAERLSVPLRVDVSAGTNWLDTKELPT